MTRSEIRTIARKRLGETTSAFWTDAELNLYINLGCKDIAWRTKCLRSNGTIAVSSCTQNTAAAVSNEFTLTTSLSTAFFAVNEVYFKRENKDYIRLTPSSREELDVLNRSWMSLIGRNFSSTAGVDYYNYEAQCSEPTHYYWNREEDVLGIYPPPNADNDTAPLKVYYSRTHTDLSADTASPTLPEGIQLAVVDFVVATGFADRGWGERANDMWNKYKLKIKEYAVEKRNEREDDEIISKPYRNI